MKNKNNNLITDNKRNINTEFFFIIIMFSIPFLVFFALEISLRFFDYGDNLQLFQKSSLYKGYYETNPVVSRRYFAVTNGGKIGKDVFLINKPDSAFRIFVLGESTTRGCPYESGVSFPRILYYRLQDAFPQKRIEVVNLGMDASTSYTVYDFAKEIIKYKPDAVLIYAGHNEFYGALGVGSVENGGNFMFLKSLYIKLVHLRTFQLIQNSLNKLHFFNKNPVKSDGTLMERIVKNKKIEFKSDTYYKGIEQYKNNMDKVLSLFHSNGIPVVMSELVSNVHENKPFVSIDSKKFPRADSIFNLACTIEKNKDFDNAKKKFYEAKDLDGLRFRAPEDINLLINRLGEKYNVPVVAMKSYFENNSPNGLIGYNLITEHLHPNIDGYFLIADAFYNTIKQMRLIGNWNNVPDKPSSYYRNNWGFTKLDSLFAEINVKALKAGWPFQPDTVVNRFALEYRPSSIEDSMAFMCYKYDNIFIEGQHKELIKKFELNGDFFSAYKEYNSMIKCHPYLYQPYINGARCLIKAKEYDMALMLLQSLPGFDTCYYANLQLAIVYMKLEKPLNAVDYLEKAGNLYKNEYNREQYLLTLYDAYMAANLVSKADDILKKIQTINPNYQDVPVKTNKEYFQILDRAKSLEQNGKLNESLTLLYKAQVIKDDFNINMLIANLLIKKKDLKAIDYLENAYNFKKEPEILKKLCILYMIKKDHVMANEKLKEFKVVSKDSLALKQLIKEVNKLK